MGVQIQRGSQTDDLDQPQQPIAHPVLASPPLLEPTEQRARGASKAIRRRPDAITYTLAELADFSLMPAQRPILSSPPSPPPPPPPAVITGRALAVAADFAEYMCGREYIQSEALSGLTVEARMRLFALVGRIYLPALDLDQRR